jgi:glycosyltransferase involved in cell wall biosynthesis
MKTRLIVIGPLPPPYHGVTISTELVLANPELRARFDVVHLDTSDHRPSSNVGRWDWTNLRVGLQNLRRLVAELSAAQGAVYLPLSQSAPGFLRDSLFIRAAAKRNWAVAVHLRGSEFRTFYDCAPRLLRLWIRRTLARVEGVGVMGDSLRHVFDGLVPDERVDVVPNGTPNPAINGASRDPRQVLFLSNLRRRKGVVEAVEAALLVLKEDHDARFLFAGEWEDGVLERSLRQRAEGANGRVEFSEPLVGPEKDAALASSALLLFPPTEPEGHPRVVLEAMAAGLPVVATDRGAIAETVVDGETGFVLNEADPRELAQRIGELLQDEELCRRMGRAAHARYLRHYTQQQADHRLAEWLHRVAVGSDPG